MFRLRGRTGEKGDEEQIVQFLAEEGESPKGGECFSDGVISIAKSQKIVLEMRKDGKVFIGNMVGYKSNGLLATNYC